MTRSEFYEDIFHKIFKKREIGPDTALIVAAVVHDIPPKRKTERII